ncbi:MAG: hypothetical protein GF390_00455 [Candidatus Pacebacteria bacterium]|nr:hypothetical protein [Candidatus Paceibacterota bacterium]
MKNRAKLLITILTILFIAGMGLASYLTYQNCQLREQLPSSNQTPITPNVTIFLLSAGQQWPNIVNRTWPLYNNYDYNFSFQFPPEWYPSCDKTKLQPHSELGGGGFIGLNIDILEKSHQTSLKDFLLENKYVNKNSLETYKLTNSEEIYIERQTPGAGPGQTAYVSDGRKVIKFYCGNCNNELLETILSTFSFNTYN